MSKIYSYFARFFKYNITNNNKNLKCNESLSNK